MKHAFLIISHNEFEVLQMLIDRLDSERTDIFVHIDKKVKALPALHTSHSELHVLEDRIDVRWGHVSQIECELHILETAYNQEKYEYFHIISGVTLPLVSIDKLLCYYDKNSEFSLFSPFDETFKYSEDYKIRFYNLCTRNVGSSNHRHKRLAQFVWTLCNHIQKTCNVCRYKGDSFISAANWCSLIATHVKFLIDNKETILKKYRFTYCADEIFVPSELTSAGFSKELLCDKRYLLVEWENYGPKVYNLNEYDSLMNNGYLYARKFTSKI